MINMTEYAQRRKTLMQQIGATGLAILPSAQEHTRNGDTPYFFRQNSDFYYLTGFNEPEAILVLAPKRKEGEYILFNRPRNREHEIWDGPRAGQAGARKRFFADQAFAIEEFSTRLPELLLSRQTIHAPFGANKIFDEVILSSVHSLRGKARSGVQLPATFTDIAPSLHEMRLFKSSAEIAVMQKAIDISQQGHVRAMQTCRPGIYEYELAAELMYAFQRNGVTSPAYSSIVGSGANSCVLHYVTNTKKIQPNDLVLVDAGAEYQNYAADITRTFPANGRFSAEQRAVYEIVLAAQLAAIKAIKPGLTWHKPQQIIVRILTQGLLDLGILKGNLETLIAQEAYHPYYMHHSGHWLGLDVHDAGLYKTSNQWRTLQPGMVLTVEPGLYLAADIPNLPKRWHNIGVRIEDDVAVTAQGHCVLSQAIPKTIAEIETVMAK